MTMPVECVSEDFRTRRQYPAAPPLFVFLNDRPLGDFLLYREERFIKNLFTYFLQQACGKGCGGSWRDRVRGKKKRN